MLKNLKDKLNLRIIPHNDIHLPCLITLAGLIIGIILISLTPQLQFRFYNKTFEWSICLSMLLFILQKNKFLLLIFSILMGIIITINFNFMEDLSTKEIGKLTKEKLLITGKISSHPYRKYGLWKYKLKNVSIETERKSIVKSNKIFVVKLNQKAELFDKLIIETEGIEDINFFNSKYYHILSPKLIKIEKEKSILIKISQKLNRIIESNLLTVENHSSRAILRSLLTANRSELSEIQKNAFRQCGLSHLLALSGLHIIVIISFLFLIQKPIPIPTKTKNILIICCIWIFYLSTGCPPTLFRASTAASFYLVASIFQRRGNSKNALGAAGTLWLLLNPTDLFSPGFQLSFTASFLILEIAPILEYQKSNIKNKIAKIFFIYMISPTFISTVIIIFTAPIIIYHFGMVSWGGLVLNIPALFLTNLSIYLFLAGIFLSPLFIGKYLLNISAFVIELLCNLIKISSNNLDFQLLISPIPLSLILMLITIYVTLKLFPKINWKIKGVLITVFMFVIMSSILLDKGYQEYDIYQSNEKNMTFINKGKTNIITTIKSMNRENRIANLSLINEWRRRTYCNSINILIIKNLDNPESITQYLQNIKVSNIILIDRITENERHYLQMLAKNYPFQLIEFRGKELQISNRKKDLIFYLSTSSIKIGNNSRKEQFYNKFRIPSGNISENEKKKLFKTTIKFPLLIRI